MFFPLTEVGSNVDCRKTLSSIQKAVSIRLLDQSPLLLPNARKSWCTSCALITVKRERYGAHKVISFLFILFLAQVFWPITKNCPTQTYTQYSPEGFLREKFLRYIFMALPHYNEESDLESNFLHAFTKLMVHAMCMANPFAFPQGFPFLPPIDFGWPPQPQGPQPPLLPPPQPQPPP